MNLYKLFNTLNCLKFNNNISNKKSWNDANLHFLNLSYAVLSCLCFDTLVLPVKKCTSAVFR